MRWAVAVLLLAACNEKSRSTDTSSRSFKTVKERTAFLCAYALCPTPPKDAAFHIVFHDNSQGFVPGPSDGETVAVVKIAPDDAERWARGCTAVAMVARPDWADGLMAEHPEWAPKTPPDLYACGPNETRRIHVKDGVVLWEVSAR